MLYNNMLIYVDIIIFLVLHILFIDTPKKIASQKGLTGALCARVQ